MMREAIKNFSQQFDFTPVVENEAQLKRSGKFVVAGMGGSHLAAGLLKVWNPYLDIVIHREYGLPAIEEKDLQSRLCIASSYSGNTEEVIDFF